MKALRVIRGQLLLEEAPVPSDTSEALVRVTLSGICNTDLEIARGYAGFTGTIGHEFVGVVEEAPGCGDLAGRRVVGEINAGCGSCALCRAGDPRHCPERTVLGIVGRDGAHAEYLALPARNLLAVPDAVSDEAAVFVEPLAAAYGISEQVDVHPGTTVAVIGDGKLGLLCAMSMALRSKDVTLIGKHASKLAIAERRGIRTALVDDLPTSSPTGFDVVVEASGSQTGIDTAVSLVRPRGRIVLKSTFQGSSAWPASRIVVDEITVVGSRCGRFAPAVDLLARGVVDPTDLISETLPLADGVAAMELAAKKGVLKVLLRP